MGDKIKKIIDLRPNWSGVNIDVIILDKKDVGSDRQKTPMYLFWVADFSASIVLHLLGNSAIDLMPGDMLRIRSCSTYLTKKSLRVRIDGGGFFERFNHDQMPFAYSPNMSLTHFTESSIGHFNAGDEIYKRDWSETIEMGYDTSKLDRNHSYNLSKDEIQDEIQELLKSQELLKDIDLDSITSAKTPSFVDYTTMVLTSPKKGNISDISTEAAELLAQVQDELKFEKQYSTICNSTDLGPPPVAVDISDFELQERWCCICSEDAQVFCLGCDDDEYCANCFRKGHLEGEYAKHVAKKISE